MDKLDYHVGIAKRAEQILIDEVFLIVIFTAEPVNIRGDIEQIRIKPMRGKKLLEKSVAYGRCDKIGGNLFFAGVGERRHADIVKSEIFFKP